MVEMSSFAQNIMSHKYLHEGETGWRDIAERVVMNVVKPHFPDLVDDMVEMINNQEFLPGGRYLYASGKPFHQTQNCLLTDVEDSREGWAGLMQRATSGLMTGAGIGTVYSKLRERDALIKGMGGKSSGPCALMQMVNESGRHIQQGGSRRAALWAGLHWWHPDVWEFITLKDWSDEIKALKEADYNFPATMDGTNISVILDDEFFAAYRDDSHNMHEWARSLYWTVVEKMLTTGEPGFSVDIGENAGENLRNACTEITSRDDNDICNLGSLNLANIDTPQRFARCVELSTVFLLCGTLYSKVPYAEVDTVRTKNRRLGLGLMGVYEWLVKRGYRYGPNPELGHWMEEYVKSTQIANDYADRLDITRPVKTRALAPTGTIGILAGTTTGIEPLFAHATKRRYLKGTKWHYQYVIDATAKRLVDQGIQTEMLETAYDLAKDPERRLAFQAWMQQYVDHGISSTINLPNPDVYRLDTTEFGETLMNYLPHVRGITVYPDGARGGQPLNVVSFEEADGHDGVEYEETGNERACVSGVCGI